MKFSLYIFLFTLDVKYIERGVKKREQEATLNPLVGP